MGVPLFGFLDGEDKGPTDRAIDLRGGELRWVLIGDILLGGRLILRFRVLPASADSGIVPGVNKS